MFEEEKQASILLMFMLLCELSIKINERNIVFFSWVLRAIKSINSKTEGDIQSRQSFRNKFSLIAGKSSYKFFTMSW